MRRVLVAIRSSERGLPVAATHARLLAETLGAELTLVSCVFDPLTAFELDRAQPSAVTAQGEVIEKERATLESLAQSLRDRGARADTKVIWDRSVYQGLLHEARESRADLLVVGAHEPKVLSHTPFTNVDAELMRYCPCPLLIVKGPRAVGYRAMFAAIDPLHRHAEPSGLDRAVLSAAREIGHAFGVPWRVVHAFPDPANFAVVSSVEVSPGVFYGTENVEWVHRQAVQELAGEYGVPSDRVDLHPGQPGDVIAEVVRKRGMELVVLGAVKRGWLAQALLGSTAERVVAEVECDVLLVPAPATGD
jgi:universal stress protein E